MIKPTTLTWRHRNLYYGSYLRILIQTLINGKSVFYFATKEEAKNNNRGQISTYDITNDPEIVIFYPHDEVSRCSPLDLAKIIKGYFNKHPNLKTIKTYLDEPVKLPGANDAEQAAFDQIINSVRNKIPEVYNGSTPIVIALNPSQYKLTRKIHTDNLPLGVLRFIFTTGPGTEIYPLHTFTNAHRKNNGCFSHTLPTLSDQGTQALPGTIVGMSGEIPHKIPKENRPTIIMDIGF